MKYLFSVLFGAASPYSPAIARPAAARRINPALPRLAGACCLSLLTMSLLLAAPGSKGAEADGAGQSAPPFREAYREIPMPPRFHVEHTELEGPVFANEEGKTLYTWPQLKLRNGYSGEAAGQIACYDEVVTVSAGLMSPYPAGLQLPELDSRPSCTDLWPPVLAATDAEPIGEWSLLLRKDGARQWAYREQALYTSVRDKKPGDTYGGYRRKRRADGSGDGDSPAGRVPAGPPPLLPPGFAVKTTSIGRMLTTHQNYAVYAFDGDSADKVACAKDCTRERQPLLAPALAKGFGEWSVLERAPGVRQWVYRDAPLYTYTLDPEPWSQVGSDAEGWRNVFTQRVPPLPTSFTRQRTLAGIVLATAEGKTIYTYQCGDDSVDQLACDHPEDTQVYRLAICGGGDAVRCRERWPYVVAGPRESSVSRAWRVVEINPETGRFADAGDPEALRVWAYRERPVYTYEGDKKPGDVHGGGTGEWRGKRNGLRAHWLRDDYMRGIQ
ncbi:hypothetical protein [Congregibacter litoralis]|uniref:Lipoprotein n=1 Tax=Congregibacter litoralis KT71 TaxID=314285 RepID=A4A7Z5_9GAMM|nr:hypothetical protein [Congregibacter litoralis]EAQ97790.2 hypothetical protein KT71_14509 [Congregibacter litoralis KT71]